MEINVLNIKGKDTGRKVKLDKSVFGIISNKEEEERCLSGIGEERENGTRFAYTDTSGHQKKFCQLTHLMFGHVGQTTCASKFEKPGRPRNKK